MNYEIVVCRWEEDLEKTKELFSGLNAYIYSISNNTIYYPYNPDGEHLDHENVGREGHVYLSHIVNFYDDLSEWTVFTQADPVCHCGKFVERVSSVIANPPVPAYVPIASHKFTCSSTGAPSHPGIPLREVWDTLFIEKCPGEIEFCANAIFAVHKDIIRIRSEQFYEKCVNLLNKEVDPPEGYAIERLWSYIFNPDYTEK